MRNILFFFLVAFLPLYGHSTEETKHTPTLTGIQTSIVLDEDEKNNYAEGFLAGTIVKTIEGNKNIEDLESDDIIITDSLQGEVLEQSIVGAKQETIGRYVKIIGTDDCIYTACHQKFYLPYEGKWVNAQDIKPHAILGKHFIVDHIEIIDEDVQCFAITVENHSFYILDDVLVHNANFLMLPITRIVIGNIIALNPIIATIGVTSALVTVSVGEFWLMENEFDFDSARVNSALPMEQEKHYYETRKQQLELLKNNFLAVEKELESMAQLRNLAYFTYIFLHESGHRYYPKLQQLHVFDTRRLNSKKATDLSKIRQAHLQQLERDILISQATIAFHCNELIERKNTAWYAVTTLQSQIAKTLALWNKGAISKTIVIQSYELELMYKELLTELEHKNNELRLAIDYYEHTTTASIVKNTTNIIQVLGQHSDHVQQIARYVEQEKKAVIAYQEIFSEHSERPQNYATGRRVRAMHKRRTTTYTEEYDHSADMKHCMAEKIKIASRNRLIQEQLATEQRKATIQFLQEDLSKSNIPQSGKICSGGSPDDPEDPDKNRHKRKNKISFYEKNIQHIFGNREGHMIDTPENRKLLLDLVADEANKMGIDKYENQWYGKTLPDGTQLWAWVRNDLIRDGGLNKIPRKFNPETGFCKPNK